ncbi:Pol Polyprotein [Phytophthora megakarya]|uniref:Pol Polyprotein n=1 Tax=Phytophthora megakarya TaxID=4795 RepID=A0A225W209_9STRA|nr:Pol Polyprotein [Phytophthora megakarya]
MHTTLRKSWSGTETLQGGPVYKKMELESPPTDTSKLTSLPVMSWKRFAKDRATESEDTLKHRDVLPDEIPAEFPQAKGIQHENDLVSGTKYCVTWQWPPLREQVKAIDDFFESRRKAGHTADVNRIDAARTYTPSSSLLDEVKAAYAHDAEAKQPIEFLSVPSDKAHDNADRIVCQRVKPAPQSQAPLQQLPTPSECWEAVSMDFVFGLPRESKRKTDARLFVDMVFNHHGMPNNFVSNLDPRFTHVNRVLVDLPKSYAQLSHNWRDFLPMAEFAINNAGTDPDKANELGSGLSSEAMNFGQERQAVVRFVQDAIVASADKQKQKLNADNVGRVSGFGASKLAPRFIGPFTVAERHGSAYTLELPSDMRLHPTFYVGRLKPYVQHESSSRDDSPTTTRGAPSASPQASSPSPGEDELVPTPQHGCLRWSERLRSRKPSARPAAASAQRSTKPERAQELPREVERLKTLVNLGLTI